MKGVEEMPSEKSDYSFLVYAGMVIVFLVLACVGAYVIFSLPVNVPAGVGGWGAYGYGSQILIDGVPPENLSEPYYVRNDSFSGTWHFSTGSEVQVDDSCLILALVDYNQTSLTYNGSLGASHTIEYRTPVSCNVSFALTGLQEGFHDVSFFVVLDPYIDIKGDPVYGVWRPDGFGQRYNVIVGNATKPEVVYGAGPLEKYVTYQNSTANNLMGYGPWLTKVPFAVAADGLPSAIQSMTVSSGQDLDYYINVKNGFTPEYERYNQFALVQLLDYEQVPLRQDVPVNVYYGTLDPGRMAALHASIKAPSSPGTHVLSLVLAKYPYDDDGSDITHMSSVIGTVILNVK